MNRLPRFELEDFFRRFAFQPEMINLSPSSPVSPTIGELLELAGLPPTALQALSLDYSETAGAWTLRQAVAALYDDLEPEQVIVTSGAVEAIALTLEALVEPDNEGSIRVLEGAGFRREGLLQAYLDIHATRADALLYSLIGEDVDPSPR